MNEKEDGALRILAPLDGSPLAESIFAALMPLVARRPVAVTLLRVINRVDEIEAERAYLKRIEGDLRKEGVNAESLLEFGQTPEEILHLAKPGRFDLVAMTTHGRTGVPRIVLGSVADHVLRRAEIPLILRRPEMKIADWRRIVVALDGTVMAEAILDETVRIAKLLKATLHVVRVTLPLLPMDELYVEPTPIDREEPQRYVDLIRDRLLQQGILAIPSVKEGFAGAEIVRVANEVGAGLIAMTTEGRCGKARLMEKSVAGEVLHNAPCPVLLRRAAMSESVSDPQASASR